MDTRSTACANGHPMHGDDTFCGTCGAPSMSDRYIAYPEPTVEEAATAQPATPVGVPVEDSTRSHPLRGVLVALMAVVVIVMAITALSGSNGSSTDQTPTPKGDRSASTQGDEIIGRTPYGCDVIRAPGTSDGTMVRIPYCTEVHAIESYCGRPAGEVTVPPAETTLDGTTFRDFTGYPASYGDAYDRFVLTPLTVRDPQATLVRLVCWNGSGHAWTNEEWSAVISPS
jgi:hypothetical protein